jgi:amino acid transporter
MFTRLKRWLIGQPIASHHESHERLSIFTGIAIFASDALSSTAYATEEILLAFVGAGTMAVHAGLLSIPVAIAIIALLILVVASYRQVIETYPQGGGTYNVSKARLGTSAGLIAGAALMIDYILTASVSVSAGISALTSAGIIPDYTRVMVAVSAIAIITWINLRGVRESGRVFVVPIYSFILCMLIMVAYGGFKVLNGEAPGFSAHLTNELHTVSWTDPLVVFWLLKAFSHGCSALTGIEAVSNGVKAFKEPTWVNANKTLVILGVLLTLMFGGVTVLAFCFNIMPAEHGETVLSMLGRQIFGGDTFMYYALQFTTLGILVLGANTAFAGFPSLCNILAQDNFLPRQMLSLGDRLVFSNGIVFLCLMAIALIVHYKADPHDMIPLYAVGVFLSFTLSQASMVVYHWQERKTPAWWQQMAINALGTLTTGVVTVLLAVEKFWEGAWIVIVAIPLIVLLFSKIKNHYQDIGRQLALPDDGQHCPVPIEHTVLVLVSSLNRGTIPALEYAKTISDRVEAVHVELSTEGTRRLRDAWDNWGCDVPLTILKSPYRAISGPLLEYIEEVEDRYEHDLVTIIVPEFVTKRWWHNILHNQTSLLIKTLLRFRKGKVVTTVRYYLDV